MSLRGQRWLQALQLPDWVDAAAPPSLAELAADLRLQGLRLAPAPADGLHYETRIAAHGLVATRPDNWHDAYNALMWSRWPALKRALNRCQAEDVARVGPKQRTRRQMAITQVDEAGVVVACRAPALLAAWDRHDWTALFLDARAAWGHDIDVCPLGHALLEHLRLQPHLLLTAKALVLAVPPGQPLPTRAQADHALAVALLQGQVLGDPQHARPLPLSGLPGAWPQQDAAFYAGAECFRPLRAGRVYPAAIGWAGQRG